MGKNCNTPTRIYFSHPIGSYATPNSLRVLRELHKTYKTPIIDPEDFNIEIDKVPCKDCLESIMRDVIFPAMDKCSHIALWAPTITCRIECELHYAWIHGKEAIFVTVSPEEVEFEPITLQQFHYIELVTEAV